MYWPFGATVCMWAILSQSYFCYLMICTFQWERMLLQTAEVALIQMSHIQVLNVDNMNLCVFWNVQHTNETEWRWKKFHLCLASQTCSNCVWGQLIWGRYSGFYLGQTLWKLDYRHFQIRRHFFQNNITSLIQFRMFFSKSENEVWMELKPDGCCKNLKHYYSRKCTLNQSNEKVLHFFHNKWHEKCSNFKVDF